MNQSRSAFTRYKIIDNLLRNRMKRFPTMQEIIDACERKLDFAPSPETIQKDIANMRSPYPQGFDAPIRFNRARKGYEYTDLKYVLAGVNLRPDEVNAIKEAVEVIRNIGGSHISDKFNHAVEKILSTTLEQSNAKEAALPVLQTMVLPTSRGFEYFDLFYNACRDRIPTSFIHFSYKKRTFKAVTLHPFLIKEFDNRWYIIGHSENHEGIRTFGLDRVFHPLLLKKKYIITDRRNSQMYLDDVYGVFPIPDKKKQKVQIYVSRLSTHYFQAYPIHHSQKIAKESEGNAVITFDLIPSVELARYLLSYGHHIENIKPEWFAKFTNDLIV